MNDKSIVESTDLGVSLINIQNNKSSIVRVNRRKLKFIEERFKICDSIAELEK